MPSSSQLCLRQPQPVLDSSSIAPEENEKPKQLDSASHSACIGRYVCPPGQCLRLTQCGHLFAYLTVQHEGGGGGEGDGMGASGNGGGDGGSQVAFFS